MSFTKTSEWKQNIEKLLLNPNICAVCMTDEDLNHWDSVYHLYAERVDMKLESIFETAFGANVTLLPTPFLCDDCVTIVLQSYLMQKRIQYNHAFLNKYFTLLSQQVTVGVNSEQHTEKQLFLTIDNIKKLKVPSTVTKKIKKENEVQILFCKVDELSSVQKIDIQTTETEVLIPGIFKYECPFCGKQHRDYITFSDHFKQHKDLFYRCPKCSRRFKLFKDIINHRNRNHSENLTICNDCRIILLDPNATEHVENHTINVEPHQLQEKYVCEKCLKEYDNEIKLEHHRCHYACSQCQNDCLHEHYLASYRKQHMSNHTSYECPDCDFKYSIKSQIICHANEVHLNHYPYLCDFCGECFAARPYLTSHMYKRHPDVAKQSNDLLEKLNTSLNEETLLQCKLCELHFTSSEEYEKHQSRHWIENTSCKFCDETFINIGQLNIHMKAEHPNENMNRTTMYSCTMCPLDFETNEELTEHLTTHPIGTNHVCRICEEIFISKRNYQSHLKSHKVQNVIPCLICFKKYTKSTIKRHVTGHLVENKELEDTKSYICDVCENTFNNEWLLYKHSEEHTEQTLCPHCNVKINKVLFPMHLKTHRYPEKYLRKCPECDYMTKFAVCLSAHINRHHLKVRPYTCDICDKNFYAECTLKEHLLTHQSQRETYYCNICGKKMISKKALTLHLRIHTGETPYPCELCNLSFLSASRRKQHVIRKHYEPSIECPVCHKMTYTQRDLGRHMSALHGNNQRKAKAKAKIFKEEIVIEEQIVDMDE